MHAHPTAEGPRQDRMYPAAAAIPVSQKKAQEQGKGISILDSARQDLEATLQLLADRAQYITGASGAAIALRDGDRVLCRASSGSAAPELGACLDLRSGLSGESVRTRMALRCDDVATDSRVDRASCRRLGIASFAVMPIIRKGDVIGIFEVFAGKPRAFQERDIAALERLREMVNTALDEASPERAKPSSFAVHGAKVKALAAAAGAGTRSLATTAPGTARASMERAGFLTALPGAPERHEENINAVDRVKLCQRCGFPVSEGRQLCLDCEEKGVPAGAPAFLSDPGSSSTGVKSWILRNRYIIGMVLISAATIAFALLR